MSFNNISFILHQPQLSENIGACARSIKNFNFKKLVVVNPKPIFPNDKILATSVGAKDVIIIAHMVASTINFKGAKYSKSKKVSLANKSDVQAITNLCIKKLEEKGFFKPLEKRPIMLENLRSIFSKMELSKKEIRILSSVFASLAKKG